MKKSFNVAIQMLFLIIFYNLANASPHLRTTVSNSLRCTDSIPDASASIIIYRPYDQLKRKYMVYTSEHGAFSLARQEAKTFENLAHNFTLTVDALGHKSGRYTFDLSSQKVHYLRIQDRNNYAGLLPFLEVIEVTEQTYKNDLNLVK